MCEHCESPEVAALNREAYAALQVMLADKPAPANGQPYVHISPRWTAGPAVWRRRTRFRPMGVR